MLSDLKRSQRDTSVSRVTAAAQPPPTSARQPPTPAAVSPSNHGPGSVPAPAGLSGRHGASRSRRAALVVAVAGGVALWQRGGATPAALSGDKPSVAVLYFENNTGNPQLDWLRTGLTDMLVTDLSQSPDVEVLGTDRLVQILTQMKRQDDRQISFDTVQELASAPACRTSFSAAT